MKPVPGELPDLIRPARQKLPVFLIHAAGGGVVPKHLRLVVLGVVVSGREPNDSYAIEVVNPRIGTIEILEGTLTGQIQQAMMGLTLRRGDG
jgi:hypothetical protein